MSTCSLPYAAWVEAEYLNHLETEWATIKQLRGELESFAAPTPRRLRAKTPSNSTVDTAHQLRQIAHLRSCFDQKLTYWAFHQHCKTLKAELDPSHDGVSNTHFIDFSSDRVFSKALDAPIVLGGERVRPPAGADHPSPSVLQRLGFTLTLEWLVCSNVKFNRFALKRIYFRFEDACRNLPVGAHIDEEAGHIVLRVSEEGYPSTLDKEQSYLRRFYHSSDVLQGLDSDDDMSYCIIAQDQVPLSSIDANAKQFEERSKSADHVCQVHMTLTKQVAAFIIRTCVQTLFHNMYRSGKSLPWDVYIRIWEFVDPVYDVIGNAQHLIAHFARVEAERKKQEKERKRLAQAVAQESERLRRESVPAKSQVVDLLCNHFISYARHNAGGSGRNSLWCVIRVCESASWGRFFIREGKAPPTKYYLDCEFDAFDNQGEPIGLAEGYLTPSELSTLLRDQLFPRLRGRGFQVHGHIQRNYDSDDECESEFSFESPRRKKRRKQRTKAGPDLRWRARVRLGWMRKPLNANSGYGHSFDDAKLRGDIEFIP